MAWDKGPEPSPAAGQRDRGGQKQGGAGERTGLIAGAHLCLPYRPPMKYAPPSPAPPNPRHPHKHTAMSRARDTLRGERAAGLRACHAR